MPGFSHRDVSPVILFSLGIHEAQAMLDRRTQPSVLRDALVECGRYRSSVISFTLRKRKALAITDTELRLIAVAAIMGLSKTPKKG
jgi:hypothetical protein